MPLDRSTADVMLLPGDCPRTSIDIRSSDSGGSGSLVGGEGGDGNEGIHDDVVWWHSSDLWSTLTSAP